MEHGLDPNNSFLLSAMAIFSLLILSTGIESLCRKIKIPFMVGLLITGILLAWGDRFFELYIFSHFQFSPEIIFYVFLPTLIFESAYHLDIRLFRGVIAESVLLSILGLLISVGIITNGLHFLLDIPWIVSLLFGVLISATDPVAVIAIFKELKAPKKLETIVEGESLLNDSTALVLFQAVLLLALTQSDFSLASNSLQSAGEFLWTILKSLLLGTCFGFLFAQAIGRSNHRGVQLTLGLVLAHITFIAGEALLGASGILATVIAGLFMGNMGKQKLNKSSQKSFSEIWEFLSFVSNVLVFLLLGMKIGNIDLFRYGYEIMVSSLIILLLARPLSVFVSFMCTNRFRSPYRKVSLKNQIVISWAGLRGVLAAAAVLLIPETYAYAELLQALTAGVILVIFILNSISLPWLMEKFGITVFSQNEKIQKLEAQVLIAQELKLYLKQLWDKKYILESSFEDLRSKYESDLGKALTALKKTDTKTVKNKRETEKVLAYYALGIEMQTYERLFEIGEINEDRSRVLRGSVFRQIEFLDRNIFPEERNVNQKVAPEIPKNILSQKTISNSWWGRKIQRYRLNQSHKKILLRMMHYRARRISSWKVIQSFEALATKHPFFKNNSALKKTITRYKAWNKNSEKKLSQLQERFPSLIEKERLRIAQKECLKKEKKLEKIFFQQGFVCEKVYQQMLDEVQKKEKACFFDPS